MKATPLPGSDYINASFVDDYKQCNAFIATQCPMENTTNDFWRMMWESQSAVIVMLSNPEHDKENFYKFWPDDETEYGKVKVSLKSKNERNSYNGYKFSIVGEAVKAVPLQVTLLHYTAWPSEKAPSNTKAILGVTKELLEIQRHTGNKAITVMCSDGCGCTGSFIAIYYTLERVKAEQTVDIFQAIKNSRICQTALVSNVEQYQYCAGISR
ncbi:receptor-type tyrosine-protein phosphatase alpha-like isoform X2 [Dysidea avara]|uniref:receptor-type tyrosine-protein phosphatase alpha-like isoform X2 n=1 Tax=Dysidea avara TaxID=196820 RepID=UPI00333000B8